MRVFYENPNKNDDKPPEDDDDAREFWVDISKKVKSLPRSLPSLQSKLTKVNLKSILLSLKERFVEYRYIIGSFMAGIVLTITLLFAPVLGEAEKLGESVELFGNILADLEKTYVDPVDTNKLFNTAVTSMLSSLDPYTEFETRAEAADMRESVSGKYGGVGLVISGRSKESEARIAKGEEAAVKAREVNDDGDDINAVDDAEAEAAKESAAAKKRRAKQEEIRVVGAFEGYAYDAGMRVGDKLIAVNDKNVEKMTVEQVRNELRGDPGSIVSINFERDGVQGVQTLDLKRSIVKIRDVRLTTFVGDASDAIGYIQLGGFSQDAGAEVRASIEALQNVAEKESKGNKLEGLILDLRGNPGGLLTSAVDVSSLLVPKGSDIVSAKGRGFPSVLYRSRTNPLLDPECKLVVLVNGGTASAAEIVSGAVQDLDVGVILGGDRTYGKGLVQNVEELPYDTALKFTVAKYFTPSGRCIQSTKYNEGDTKGYLATNVKDNDRKVFKTKAGRIIKDGGGIEVDVKVKPPKASALEVAILRSGVLNDFASKWSKTNSIASGFRVTDDLYKQFQDMVAEKEKSGEIPSLTSLYNQPLDTLNKQLKDSGYNSAARELKQLRSSIRNEMAADFRKYDKDIKEDISNAILARYLPESMLLEKSLATDTQVNGALKVIKDGDKFETILARRGGKVIGGKAGKYDANLKELARRAEEDLGSETDLGVRLNLKF